MNVQNGKHARQLWFGTRRAVRSFIVTLIQGAAPPPTAFLAQAVDRVVGINLPGGLANPDDSLWFAALVAKRRREFGRDKASAAQTYGRASTHCNSRWLSSLEARLVREGRVASSARNETGPALGRPGEITSCARSSGQSFSRFACFRFSTHFQDVNPRQYPVVQVNLGGGRATSSPSFVMMCRWFLPRQRGWRCFRWPQCRQPGGGGGLAAGSSNTFSTSTGIRIPASLATAARFLASPVRCLDFVDGPPGRARSFLAEPVGFFLFFFFFLFSVILVVAAGIEASFLWNWGFIGAVIVGEATGHANFDRWHRS